MDDASVNGPVLSTHKMLPASRQCKCKCRALRLALPVTRISTIPSSGGIPALQFRTEVRGSDEQSGMTAW